MPRRSFSAQLRRSACFHRLTGVHVATFERMVAQLRAPWEAAERRKTKSGRPWEVGGLEDHLLIMLLYYRCYVTQEFIGFFWKVDRSVICRAIRRIERHAQPLFGVRRDPQITRREAEALIVDCTEQPIQRPGDDAVQRAHYSGKKKRHTLKTEYVVTAQGRIVSVSDSHPGSRHDLTIRRDGAKLARSARVYADSAYQGYEREHAAVEIPYKRRKGGELSAEEKEYNRGLGSFRVAIEHRIGRIPAFGLFCRRLQDHARPGSRLQDGL